MGVLEAVDADLERWELRLTGVSESTRAATARALAVEIDAPDNSATSKSMCAKALASILGEIEATLPAEKDGDLVDDLQKRRDDRRRRSTAAASPRSS